MKTKENKLEATERNITLTNIGQHEEAIKRKAEKVIYCKKCKRKFIMFDYPKTYNWLCINCKNKQELLIDETIRLMEEANKYKKLNNEYKDKEIKQGVN